MILIVANTSEVSNKPQPFMFRKTQVWQDIFLSASLSGEEVLEENKPCCKRNILRCLIFKYTFQ